VITDIALGLGLIVESLLAWRYREQRDNLAAYLVYHHPEDFPEDDE